MLFIPTMGQMDTRRMMDMQSSSHWKRRKKKNNLGIQKSKITFDYAKLAKRMYDAKVPGGYFPCLLLCLDGSQFSIGIGAVYHEITTQFFTSRISMGVTTTSITQCTQALLALNECMEILCRYYNIVTTAPNSLLHSSFPQIEPFCVSPLLHEEIVVELTCRVSMNKLVFGGIGKENSLMHGQPFCIKYAPNNYSIELRNLLASSNLAPKVHYSKELSGDTLVIMSWVTNVLPNEYLSQFPLEIKLQVSNKLHDALCLMKANNFVHGDLRKEAGKKASPSHW